MLSKKTRNWKMYGFATILIGALFVFNGQIRTFAGEEKVLDGIAFEVPQEDVFDISDEYKVETVSISERMIGEFSLDGELLQNTNYDGYTAYQSDGSLEVHFNYSRDTFSNLEDGWELCSGDTKTIGDIELSSQIAHGTLVVQKSTDGKAWKNATDPKSDFLERDKDNLIVYEINDQECISGTYYRILLAYEVRRVVKEKSVLSSTFGIEYSIPVVDDYIDTNEYEYRCCTEVYSFYVCAKENPVILKDVISGADISEDKSTVKGFQIDKRGSKAQVDITYSGTKQEKVRSYTSYYEPGEYQISVTTPLGDNFKYSITIEEGLKLDEISPVVYENTKKQGYKESKKIDGEASTGITAYSTLKIGYGQNNTCKNNKSDGFTAYGITGDSVSLFLSLDQKEKMKEKGWVVKPDSWGASKSDKIYGVSTGEIKTGAVIVQTSRDGEIWVNQDQLGYADVLSNTDFEANYGQLRDVLLYTPDGNDVIQGIYIRVAYCYRAHGTETNTDYRYIENYTFYLCSDELGAVTIHNLSTEEPLAEIIAEKEDNLAEVYVHAEDMKSGSGTVTGFSIDRTLNPNVKYSVQKDSEPLDIIGGEKFYETGRYDITLSSMFGTQKEISIYVDKLSSEEAYELYFGDSFLTGKRIYSEGDYPVYEGGQVQYNLNEISESYLPLSGVITNLTTGESTKVELSRDKQSGTLISAGTYEAVFSNNPFVDEQEQSGDYRTFTFHFEIVEAGKAPGPTVNKESLGNYNRQNISGCNPHAYALIYQSASKGNIALIFASEVAAYEYALNYESGIVEQQKDGTYRYSGSFLVNKKTEYNSNWDLNDAIAYFASLAVNDWYFDFSDEYTYRTLSEEALKENQNIRTLELDQSVAIFASEDDRTELAEIQTIPIISSLPYAYLEPGINGEVTRGVNHFEFVKDENGWDSSEVIIKDSNGISYTINYNESVDTQLKAQGCAAGIVNIQEKNIYGDTSEYEAVYLPEDKNLSEITIEYYFNGKKATENLKQQNDSRQITVDSFSITDVVDETDKYSIIKVTNKGNQTTEYFTTETIKEKIWTDKGEYEFKFVNRLGFDYSILVSIEDGIDTKIEFSGTGTEEIEPMSVQFGDSDILLPKLERYGYELEGFEDEYGNVYTEEIEKVLYKGALVLSAKWQPKMVNIIMEEPDGTVYMNSQAPFGTEYTIAPYISEDIHEHVNGWLYEGKLNTDGKIKIDKEDDYILRVSISSTEVESVTEANTEIVKEKDKRSIEESPVEDKSESNVGNGKSYTVIILVLLLAIIGGISAFVRTKVTKK